MNKLIVACTAVLALFGCTRPYYMHEGKRFDDGQSFQESAAITRQSIVDSITTLPSPLTQRKLITASPSMETVLAEMHARHLKEKGAAPHGIALDQYRNLSEVNSKGIKNSFEIIRKRGIYPQVDIIESTTMSVSLEPSEDYDVLYYSEPSFGSGQYIYASVKYGKQVFAYDRSSPTPQGKAQAFVDAVQVLAIRE